MSLWTLGSWKNDGPIGFNERGGVMTQVINNTGAASIKGTILAADTAGPRAAILCPIDYPGWDWVVHEDGVPPDNPMWVVFEGPAQIATVGAATYGNMLRTCLAGDAGAAAGYAIADAYPVASPFYTDETALCIGTCTEDCSDASLVWAQIRRK